jgi:hypothetical protein
VIDRNLFHIPDGSGGGRPEPPRRSEVRHALMPAVRVGRGHVRWEPEDAPRPGLPAGLERRFEFSTGYKMTPRLEESVLPRRRSARVRLAVILATVALLGVALLGAAMALAAGR